MKTKNLFLVPALIAVLNLIPAGRVTAQTFTTLHSFSGGSDGANPQAGLILSGNTLYGTGATVFKVNTDGTGFTNLYNVGSGAELLLSGNTLYGTAARGGHSGYGTVFAVNTDGTGFTNLHSFTGLDPGPGATNSDGAIPFAGLILSGNTLYGTATYGGSSGNGTVFSLSLSLSPPEQINNLIALVPGLGLPSGTATSLVVMLQGAARALDRGNLQAACVNLGAFLNEVNAQTGKKLTAAQADSLIAEATRIRAVLGCR